MSDLTRIFAAVTSLFVSYNCIADAVELNFVSCHVSKAAYVTDLTNAYQQKTGIHINVTAGNSTSVIRDVQNGVADIGGISRYLVANELPDAGVELLPVAWDALTIIVHKDNPVESISLEQAKAIYTGKIRYWSDLGGADQKIEVYALKNKISGNGHALRELLFSNVDKAINTNRVFESSELLEQALTENPNAIAITGVSSARLQGIKIVALDGISPTVENIKSGEYGLYRPLYLSYKPDSPNIDTVKNFISFVQSKSGREVMRRNGVVPYREAISLVMKKARENEATYPLTVDNI
jgi:phosphate transport system substrate-binding protein